MIHASGFINMAGLRYGRLTVLERFGKTKSAKWLALCDCGNQSVVDGYKLRSGHTRSCGCLAIESRRTRSTRHGLSNTRTHNAWLAMRRRCSRPEQPNYQWYGGRGIKVCERWESFDNFLADMGVCPDGYELDRINTDGHYEPGNCQWITHKQNCAVGKRNYARS